MKFKDINHHGSLIYYGGSFNPPHIAHVLMVQALHSWCPNAQIWVSPTYAHAFHKSLMPYDWRIEVLHELLDHIPNVVISTIERDIHRDSLPTYTIDAVRLLHQKFPDLRIYLAIGSDIVPTLPLWHQYDELCKIAEFIVFPRQGYDNACALDIPILPDVSSTQIREIIERSGICDELDGLLPAQVIQALSTRPHT